MISRLHVQRRGGSLEGGRGIPRVLTRARETRQPAEGMREKRFASASRGLGGRLCRGHRVSQTANRRFVHQA
jgi:hypothetical protein